MSGLAGGEGSDLNARLEVANEVGDPLADRLVTAFGELPGGEGWRLLDRALSGEAGGRAADNGRGSTAATTVPPELAEMVAPALEPPSWVDLDRVERGAVAYWRAGAVNLSLALTCGSLAFGYQSARLTRPLAATGRLDRMAPRRLQETSDWLTRTTRPGALQPGGEGASATIRLRIVHALVRRHLSESSKWDSESWGVPISGRDVMLTGIGGFLVAPVRALGDLGLRYSREELDAMTHQWRWISYLMGAPEDLLPDTFSEAGVIVDTALADDCEPTDDSKALMHALLNYGSQLPLEDRLPGVAREPLRLLKSQVLGAFTRRWMEGETADFLGVPNSPLKHVVPLVRLPTLARELARHSRLLGSDRRIAAFEVGLVDRVAAARQQRVRTITPAEAASQPVLSS